MARVVFDRVTKAFGDVIALRELDLEVYDGEFLVVVGPSGCGKSTALRLVAGLDEPTSGRIFIGDRMVNDLAPKDRDVAMVFQSYALYPHMSVRDNLAHPLQLRRVPRQEIEERVRKVADLLGINDLLQRRPKELSGGQRQRVALGRAIVRDPEVFLMDEPLSNLDVKLRVRTRAELIKLHERLRTTTIYVTHDQQEAMTLGDRIAVLNAGQLQQLGTPDNLYNHPINLFVAGFIGSPSMNLLNARLTARDGEMLIEGNGFRIQVPPGQASLIDQYADRDVVIGIRPEHLFDRAEIAESPPNSSFSAHVDLLEPLGSETLLHADVANQGITARVSADTELRRGHVVELVVDTRHLHIFDRETQRALTR
ncbi:MAG TPA: sn-glycerol-3-phosphate ABC transporter ATP-binding protein UgpC [Chloroflexota bacterium]|nr:sn-glycerol-3-phosphate ABC transporter ATP-binding protein UgpC [Chloroflexota bacterium]